MKEFLIASSFALNNAVNPVPSPQVAELEPVTPIVWTVEDDKDKNKKPNDKKGDLSIVFSTVSRHFGDHDFLENGRQRPFNEFNPGIGLEYRLNEHFHLEAGAYKNSLYRTSAYAGIGVETSGSKFIGAGAQAGLLTGYKTKSPFAGMPYIRVGPRDSDVNFKVNIVPPIEGLTPGTVGVQMRVKF